MEDGIKQQFQIFRLVMAVMMKCVGVGLGGGVLWARVARKTARVFRPQQYRRHDASVWPAAVAYRLCLRRLLVVR